jgi:hypothetical protein
MVRSVWMSRPAVAPYERSTVVASGARMMSGAPCAKVYLMLELIRGRELCGRLVRTGLAKEDVICRYSCHLIPDSDTDSLGSIVWHNHHARTRCWVRRFLHGAFPVASRTPRAREGAGSHML